MAIILIYLICAVIIFFMSVTLFYFWRADRDRREMEKHFHDNFDRFGDEI